MKYYQLCICLYEHPLYVSTLHHNWMILLHFALPTNTSCDNHVTKIYCQLDILMLHEYMYHWLESQAPLLVTEQAI